MTLSTHDQRRVGPLISLADEKGYALSVSDMPDQWRLIGDDLRPAKAPSGGADFTSAEAKAFLDGIPDRQH